MTLKVKAYIFWLSTQEISNLKICFLYIDLHTRPAKTLWDVNKGYPLEGQLEKS